MEQLTKQLLAEAETAKYLYGRGEISRAEVLHRIRPYLDHINKKGEEISRRFGMKQRKVSPATWLR